MRSQNKLTAYLGILKFWKIDVIMVGIFILTAIIGNPKVIVSSQTLNSETPNKFKRFSAPVTALPIKNDSSVIQSKLDSFNLKIDKIPEGTEASKKVTGIIISNRKILVNQNILLTNTLSKLRYDSLVLAESKIVQPIEKQDSIKLSTNVTMPEVKIDSVCHKKGWLKKIFGFK